MASHKLLKMADEMKEIAVALGTTKVAGSTVGLLLQIERDGYETAVVVDYNKPFNKDGSVNTAKWGWNIANNMESYWSGQSMQFNEWIKKAFPSKDIEMPELEEDAEWPDRFEYDPRQKYKFVLIGPFTRKDAKSIEGRYLKETEIPLAKGKEGKISKLIGDAFTTSHVVPQQVKYIRYQPRKRGGKVVYIEMEDLEQELGHMTTGLGESEIKRAGLTVDDVMGYLEKHGAKLRTRRPPRKRYPTTMYD